MPYAVVETYDVLGSKELLAAPETWIQHRESGKVYLCWPNVRNITTLHKLLLDEHCKPSMMWEKHECLVKQRNIRTLTSAGKIMESLQSLSDSNESVRRRSSTLIEFEPASKIKKSKITHNEPFMTVEEILKEAGLEEPMEVFLEGEQIGDPLEDRKPNIEQLDTFSEFKTLIKEGQDETRKLLNDGIDRLEQILLSAIETKLKQFLPVQDRTEPYFSSSDMVASFPIGPFDTFENLDEFEEQLNNDDFRLEVHSWIDEAVASEQNPEYRMMIILDLLFDKQFFTKFTWTGMSKNVEKRGLMKYRNTMRLFQYTATTKLHRATYRYIADFFMKKLKHAASRINLVSGTLRSVPHCFRKKTNRRWKQDLEDDLEAIIGSKQSEQILDMQVENECDVINDLEAVNGSTKSDLQVEQVGNDSYQADGYSSDDSSSSHTHSNVVFQVTPITSTEDMNSFEARLGDPKYRRQVYKWVDATVGYEPTSEHRMTEILDLLFDTSFLAQFSWQGLRKGKQAFRTYERVIALFMYAGTTNLSRVDYDTVENYFVRRLKYVSIDKKRKLT